MQHQNSNSKPSWWIAIHALVSCCLVVTLAGCDTTDSDEESNVNSSSENSTAESTIGSKRHLTRLFWQDRDSGNVRSCDLFQDKSKFEIEDLELDAFPELNVEENDLVQMAFAGGRLFVGVRDHEDGRHHSGWLAIDPGVSEEQHGDHSHWHYTANPKVEATRLDNKQGNPAHVYQYGKCVYVANDKLNGFTKIDPFETGSNREPANQFYKGGGGHITLAAVGDQIAYSTWINRAGENAGRVDVIDLRRDSSAPKYSFHLPTGGIHGATACGNRVFFAPSEGVCWVDCDFDFVVKPDDVKVNYLSLAPDSGESGCRTGAFESFENHVLCIAKSPSGHPAVCIINGTAPNPQVTRIECADLEEGLKLSTVSATSLGRNQFRAFAFAEGDGVTEKLLVFDLDPNGDRDFSDAKRISSIEVGKSKLEGHFGHHAITFLQDQKTAVFSNPGDGTISLLSLKDGRILETFSVGGQPTHVIAIGGRP